MSKRSSPLLYRFYIALCFYGTVFTLPGWAAVLTEVSSGSSFYQTVDLLEAYGCAYSTYRTLRPQTFFDLRSAVDAEGAEACQAPEWLLVERSLLSLPVAAPEASLSTLLSQSDRVPLSGMEAQVSPLFALRDGRTAYDGFNLYLELSLGVSSGPDRDYGFAVSATPGILGAFENYERGQGRLYLHEWYVKAGYKWAELLWGRLAQGMGDTKHGSLLLSGSASPYNLVKLRVRPHILGTPLGFLGPVTLETWVAGLGESDTLSDARLWAVALGFRPLTWFDLTLLEMNQFGGQGAPSLEFSDYLGMLAYSGSPDLDGKRNRAFGMHVNVWGPSRVAKMYLQFYFKELHDISNWFSDDISVLMGLWFPKLGPVDLRLEYVNTVPRAYTDTTYLQGLVNQRTPIGHPLGPDAQGVYLDLGLPVVGSWRPEVGVLYEARAQNPTSGRLPEYRYGGGVSVRSRIESTLVGISSQYARVENQWYVAGTSNDLFAVLAFLQHSFR